MEAKLNCDGAVESELVPAQLVMMEGVPHGAVCFFKIGGKWYCVFGDFKNIKESPYGSGLTFEEAMIKVQTQVRLKALECATKAHECKYIYLPPDEKFIDGDQAIENGSVTWFNILDSIGSNLSNRPRWVAARRKAK